jgi:membrane dipeptidase
MIVDLSHAAESTFWHVLRVSDTPVMASHSNAAAISPHYRNLTDAQVQALAERGGLIGINFCSAFLDAEFWRRQQAAEERCKTQIDALHEEYASDYVRLAELGHQLLLEEMGYVPVPATRIVDHIEHMVRLVGADHVALGGDFDGTTTLPDDMPDVSHLPLVTRLLRERRFDDSDIRKILGGNVLRLFQTVCG